MTVSSIEPVNNYAGNSSNTRFDFDFLIESESELSVQYTSSTGEISILRNGIDYSVHEVGNKNGSYITFPILGSNYGVLNPDEKISLMLTLVVKQEKEIRNSLFFNFDTLEWMFDYTIRILQVVMRRLTRTLQIPEGRENFNMVLPVAKANNVFKWNETEDAIENYDIIGANTTFQNGVNADLSQYKSETSILVNEISVTANGAVSTSNTAKSTAENALSNSNIAINNSSSALQIADNALTTANNALDTADSAEIKADNAVSTANSANQTAIATSNKVDSFGDDIETVLEAASQINALEEAVTTATTAATNANAAANTANSAAQTATQKAQEAITAVSLIEQPDWNETDTISNAFILNKPDSLSDFTDDLGNTPLHTHNQYEFKDKTINILSSSGSITLVDGSINTITPTDLVTFTLPTVTDNTVFHQILVQVNLSTVVSIDVGTVYYFNSTAPDMSEIGVYNLIYEYDKANQYWVCGVLIKGSES